MPVATPIFFHMEDYVMDYKTLKIDDIITWCKANNQVEWLKAEAAKTFPTEDGTRAITFIEIKVAFARKFMPEIMPEKKEKKPSMFDLINAL